MAHLIWDAEGLVSLKAGDCAMMASDIALPKDWAGPDGEGFTLNGAGRRITGPNEAPLERPVFGHLENCNVIGLCIETAIAGEGPAGALAVSLKGCSLTAVHVSGAVASASDAGGIASHALGCVFESCRCFADIHAAGSGGGAVACAMGGKNLFSSCECWGSVQAGMHAGGIVGFQSEESASSFRFCVNRGSVASTYGYGGGLAGYLRGSAVLQSCESSGCIVSKNCSAGGIIGEVYCTSAKVQSCVCTGSVASLYSAGRLIGVAGGFRGSTLEVSSCCAEGMAISEMEPAEPGSLVGGFVCGDEFLIEHFSATDSIVASLQAPFGRI